LPKENAKRSKESNDDDNNSAKVKKRVKLNKNEKNDFSCEIHSNSHAEIINLNIPSSLNLTIKDRSQELMTNINENDYENIINPITDTLLMSENFTLKIIASFINNSFKDELQRIQILTDQAKNRMRHGFISSENDDIPLEILYSLMYESVKDEVFTMGSLLHSIPAFAKLDINDFSCIIKNKVLPYTILKYHKLKINNECYSVFKNGLQCTRAIIDKMGNLQMNDLNFQISEMLNELNLNEKEFTALMTFVLSFPRNMNIKNLNSMIEFNQLVGKILANEVFASRRDKEFVIKMRKVRIT
jgi:hypothetical protein